MIDHHFNVKMNRKVIFNNHFKAILMLGWLYVLLGLFKNRAFFDRFCSQKEIEGTCKERWPLKHVSTIFLRNTNERVLTICPTGVASNRKINVGPITSSYATRDEENCTYDFFIELSRSFFISICSLWNKLYRRFYLFKYSLDNNAGRASL